MCFVYRALVTIRAIAVTEEQYVLSSVGFLCIANWNQEEGSIHSFAIDPNGTQRKGVIRRSGEIVTMNLYTKAHSMSSVHAPSSTTLKL